MHRAHRTVLAEDVADLLARDLPWHELDGRTVLITGATGLVAAYLTDVLLMRNRLSGTAPTTVIALVRDEAKARKRFADHLDHPSLQLLQQDVVTPVPASLQADFIVHAAGNATPSRFASDPVGTYAAAVLGAHHLLAHAHATKAAGFLLLSSGAVHGAVPGETTVIDERTLGIVDQLDPYACYAEAKRMAETMCSSWTRQHGVPTRIARLGHSYGPGLRHDDDRAFAQFVRAVAAGDDIVLHSDGSAVRPYCYLADTVDALLRILLLGKDGEPYLLAHPEASCSVLELATYLVDIAPAGTSRISLEPVSGAGAVANRDPRRALDVGKLRALGWDPRTGYRDGFRRTLRSIQ